MFYEFLLALKQNTDLIEGLGITFPSQLVKHMNTNLQSNG